MHTRILIPLLLLAATAMNVVAGEPLSRIVFGSCIKQDRPAPIFQQIIATRPQLLLFLGDNVYADTADMAEMRAKYRTLGAKPGFQKLLAMSPVMATWDDHDYGVNDGGAEFPQRAQSQQVFADFWQFPNDAPLRTRPGVYDARLFGPVGQRVQVIMLDTRYFRSALKKGERRVGGPYYPDDDPAKTMLGNDQWSWLERQLQQPAKLRIIASSIQFAASSAGQETWSNLPRERARMLKLLNQTSARGVMFVSGDRHWSELSVISEDVAYPIYDLTSSSFNQLHARGTPTENANRAINKTYHKENFGVIEVDWKQADPAIKFSIQDMHGKIEISKTLRLSEL